MTDENVAWGQRPYTGRELSWHIVTGPALAACGRRLDQGTVRDVRPGRAKTCESCLRIKSPK